MGNTWKKSNIETNIDQLDLQGLEQLETKLYSELEKIKVAKTKYNLNKINWEDVRYIQKQLILHRTQIEGDISIDVGKSEFFVNDIFNNDQVISEIYCQLSQIFTYIGCNQSDHQSILKFKYNNITIIYQLQKITEPHYTTYEGIEHYSSCGTYVHSTNMITHSFLGPPGYNGELKELIRKINYEKSLGLRFENLDYDGNF